MKKYYNVKISAFVAAEASAEDLEIEIPEELDGCLEENQLFDDFIFPKYKDKLREQLHLKNENEWLKGALHTNLGLERAKSSTEKLLELQMEAELLMNKKNEFNSKLKETHERILNIADEMEVLEDKIKSEQLEPEEQE